MTTLWTDEAIAALEPAPRRNKIVYLSRGLILTIRPNGKKMFEVKTLLKREDGWTRPIRRALGVWPELPLAVARMQARHYVALAAQGVDFRRSKTEIAQMQTAYLAERHAATRTAREERALLREIERQARAEAKRIKAEEVQRKREAAAALRATKGPPRPRRTKPKPTEMIPRRTLFDMPWGK